MSNKPNKRGLPPSPLAKGGQPDACEHRCAAPVLNRKGMGPMNTDFAADFEPLLSILEDLMAIAIEEIGNGGGRALSLLLPAMRYLHDLKAINKRLLQMESGK